MDAQTAGVATARKVFEKPLTLGAFSSVVILASAASKRRFDFRIRAILSERSASESGVLRGLPGKFSPLTPGMV